MITNITPDEILHYYNSLIEKNPQFREFVILIKDKTVEDLEEELGINL